MPGALRVTLPNGGGVIQETTIVGRGSRAQLDCPDQRVSRRHLELRPGSNGWVAVDLESRFGEGRGAILLQATAEPFEGGSHQLGILGRLAQFTEQHPGWDLGEALVLTGFDPAA